MSILPTWHKGRVCVPWWYGLGYAGWLAVGISIGIRSYDTMVTALSFESTVALVACAFVGALAYTVFYAVSKYEKQKADAAKLQASIAASGRDPAAEDQLTPAERWELNKAKKFDRIFLIADAFAVIIGAGLAAAAIYLYGHNIMEDSFVKYGVLGFLAGIVVTLVINETLVKNAAQGLWEEKSAEAFQIVKAVADDVIEANGGLEALTAKLVAQGFSKREAKKLAKQKLAEDALNDD